MPEDVHYQPLTWTVNLLANAYAGSNPALPTIFIINDLGSLEAPFFVATENLGMPIVCHFLKLKWQPLLMGVAGFLRPQPLHRCFYGWGTPNGGDPLGGFRPPNRPRPSKFQPDWTILVSLFYPTEGFLSISNPNAAAFGLPGGPSRRAFDSLPYSFH
jgi:hypothetical protein